jgi:hypothetical protein
MYLCVVGVEVSVVNYEKCHLIAKGKRGISEP